jgi:transcriptional regulator with XRE-family HTH domain
MTPGEFKAARVKLGLTQTEFAKVFQVSPRAVGGWEQGERNGRKHAIPPVVALLVRAALKHQTLRRELGINS